MSLERKKEMIEALLQEMSLREGEAPLITESGTFPTLYFGGGTPSVLTPDELSMLAEKALSIYLPAGVDEFTLEANPDDLTPEYLEALKKIGVNRLSIGIQSFIDRDLKWMRRRHNAVQAIESVENAKKAGFSNISVDLIYGIPDMSITEWKHNIEQALALNVPHLSAYHLTIEPKTILGRQQERGLLSPVDDEISAEQYNILEELTSKASYLHYEISNFARAGYIAKHNSSYWKQQPYIGIGPSAHSYNGNNIRKWNVANNIKYIDLILSGENYFEKEELSIIDKYNEFVLTSLRTSWGVNTYDIKRNFNDELYQYFIKQATPAIKAGMLEAEDGNVWIPSVYFLISDSIINQLFYA